MQSVMIQTQSHRRQTRCPNADRRTECAESSPPGTGSVAARANPRRTPGHHMAFRGPEPGPRVDGPCPQGRVASGQGMRRFWWRIPLTKMRTIGSSSSSKALCPYQLEARGYALPKTDSPESGSAACTR